MSKLIFLDTETTGNDPKVDRLCQVAYKVDGQMKVKNFKPTVPISIKAMSVTNITNQMVEKEEVFRGSVFAQDLQELLNKNILVAHNAQFDVAMLENEDLIVPNYICTLKLSRYLDESAEIPEHNLQFLRYYYGVDVEVIPHSADGDVLVLEAIFEHLFKLVKGKAKSKDEESLLKRMIEISQQPSLIRTFSFGKHAGKLVEKVVKEDKEYLEWFLKTKEGEGTDEDWIYTLKFFLKIR